MSLLKGNTENHGDLYNKKKKNFVSFLPKCPVCTNMVNGNRETLNKDSRCCLMGLVINSCNKALT